MVEGHQLAKEDPVPVSSSCPPAPQPYLPSANRDSDGYVVVC